MESLGSQHLNQVIEVSPTCHETCQHREPGCHGKCPASLQYRSCGKNTQNVHMWKYQTSPNRERFYKVTGQYPSKITRIRETKVLSQIQGKEREET